MSIVEELVEKLPYPVYVLDKKGKVVVWNDECEKISGLVRAEVLNTTNFWKIYGKRVKTPAIKLLNSEKSEIEEVIEVNGKRYEVKAFKVGEFVVEAVKPLNSFEAIAETFERENIYSKNLSDVFIEITKILLGASFCELYVKFEGDYLLVSSNLDTYSNIDLNKIKNFELNVFKKLNDLCYVFRSENYISIIYFENEENFKQLNEKVVKFWSSITSAISKRFIEEINLKNKLKAFDSISNLLNIGIVFLDKKLNVLKVNRAFEKMVGKKVVGLNVLDLIADRFHLERAIKKASAERYAFCKIKILRKDEIIKCFVRIFKINNTFCCIFTSENIYGFYYAVRKVLLSNNNCSKICLNICKLINRNFYTLTSWYSINGKIYQVERSKFSLRNHVSEILCISGKKNCSECYISKVYRKSYCTTYFINKKPKIVIGIIFKKKPEKRVLKAIECVMNFLKLVITYKIFEKERQKFISELSKCLEEIDICSDKILNPLTGIYLSIEAILNSDVDKDLNDTLNSILETLKKLEDNLDKIKSLEKRLKSILEYTCNTN